MNAENAKRGVMRNLAVRWGLVLAALMTLIVGAHFLFEPLIITLFERMTGAGWHELTVAALVVLSLALDILLPIPSSVVSVWAGVSLGTVGGFAAIWLGLCAGCVFAYWLGAGSHAWLLGRFIRERDLRRAQDFSARYGAGALALLRAVPVMAETSVLAAGLVKMPWYRFLAVTGLSNAGVAFVYAYIGAYADARASLPVALLAGIAVPALAWGVASLLGRLRRVPSQSAGGTSGAIRPAFNIDFNYPVCFTRGAFDPANSVLIDHLRPEGGDNAVNVLFIVDRGVLDADPSLDASIAAYCRRHHLEGGDRIVPLPGGEAAKTQANVEFMHQRMLERHLDRQSYVVAIGGGALLDAAGYAAATFHRGVRIVRMPTTVLAQDDAGIGVKNGINAHGIKNLMGCFTVPHAVINDSHFLRTLPARDFRAGFAEAVKVALIRDGAFFDWIEANAGRLNRREEQAAGHLIRRCAELHIRQIATGGDPFETGSARPLDYGHWSAHKLESLSNHELSHGEAVAIGMALDALYAVETGYLDRREAQRLTGLLQRLGFDLWHPALKAETEDGGDALLAGLEEFRQHLGGQLCITLLSSIGRGVEVHAVDTAAMTIARDRLRDCGQCETSESIPDGVYEIGSTA